MLGMHTQLESKTSESSTDGQAEPKKAKRLGFWQRIFGRKPKQPQDLPAGAISSMRLLPGDHDGKMVKKPRPKGPEGRRQPSRDALHQQRARARGQRKVISKTRQTSEEA